MAWENKDLMKEIRLQPDLRSLLSSRIIFSKAVASGLNLQLESVGDMVGALAAFAKKIIRWVSDGFLSKGRFSFSASPFRMLRLTFSLILNGVWKSAVTNLGSCSDAGGDSRRRRRWFVGAYSWRPFKDSRFVFDSDGPEGPEARAGRSCWKTSDIHLLDGVLRGGATVGSGPDASVSGDIRF